MIKVSRLRKYSIIDCLNSSCFLKYETFGGFDILREIFPFFVIKKFYFSRVILT